MLVVGIDPGVTGAVAIARSRSGNVFDFPLIETGTTKKRREISPLALFDLMGKIETLHRNLYGTDQPLPMVFVERQQTRPTDGKVQAFTSGFNYGVILSVLPLAKFPCKIVTSVEWKKHFKLMGKDKEASRAEAIRRFPMQEPQLRRKKDHGRAEALLIAEYGRSLLT